MWRTVWRLIAAAASGQTSVPKPRVEPIARPA